MSRHLRAKDGLLPVIAVVYPNAYHAFDDARAKSLVMAPAAAGQIAVLYDATATADSGTRIRRFLAERLHDGRDLEAECGITPHPLHRSKLEESWLPASCSDRLHTDRLSMPSRCSWNGGSVRGPANAQYFLTLTKADGNTIVGTLEGKVFKYKSTVHPLTVELVVDGDTMQGTANAPTSVPWVSSI